MTAEFFSRMAFDATGSGVNSYKTGVTRVTGVACSLNLLKLENKNNVTLALMMWRKRCNGTAWCNAVLNLSSKLEATNVRFE